MISFLEGTVEYVGDKFAIINTGAIGYKVTLVPKLLNSVSKNKTGVNGPIRLFIHSQLNMREGTFDLYGFDKREDLELFNLLISVNGIGPKNAIHILATVEPQHLKAAVVNEDANYLKKVSGLGPKTAQRLVLELKNKIDYLDIGDSKGLDLGVQTQALDALTSLGYTQMQAKEALKEISNKNISLQDQVREALKSLGKK